MVSRLFERERELESLDCALASARAGAGQVVVVEAAAGCGKTALLSAAVDRAAGFQTLTGRGGEFERAAGYGVVRDLYAAAAEHGQLADLLNGAARLAQPLLCPDTGAASSVLDPAALNHGLYWLTVNLAAQHPLVLAVDDAQWADVASRRYLEYLAARIDALACVLAVAWRPGETDSDEGFVGRILGVAPSAHLSPRPLTREGTRALVGSRFSAGAPEELVERCHLASAGNPFLLHELASEIAERTAAGEEPCPLDWLATASGHAPAQSAPERLIRIVRARLSRLPEHACAVAEALAVLGPDAALRHAAAVAGVSAQQAARAADALAAADLIRPRARIDFVHPLIRRSVYDMQPVAGRAEAHARAARLLAAEQADSEVIAGHLLAAPARADAWVVGELMAAARTAMHRGAPHAAITYLHRALDEPPEAAARVEVLHALGNAEVRARDGNGLVHLRAAQSETDDPSVRLQIALDIAHAAIGDRRSGTGDIISQLSSALSRGAEREPETAMLALGLLLGASVPTASPEWRTHVEQATAMYRGADEGLGRRALAAALAFAAVWSNAPIGEMRSLGLDGMGDDEAYQGALDAGWQLTWCCPALAIAEEWDLAERRLAEALASGQARGAPRAVRNALWARMAVRSLRGDLAAAETDGRQALELGHDPAATTGMFVMFGFQLVEVLIDRASPAAAQALLAEQGLDGDGPDQRPATAQLLCTRSRLRLAQGRASEAVADAEAARAILDRAGLNPVGLFSVQERAAAALAMRGEHDRARVAAAEALSLAQANGAPAAIGMAVRAGALLQRGPEQVRQLTAAVELLEHSGRRLEHARTLIELGAAMRRQAERSAAREPLAQGRELARRCGAHALEERAMQELRASGAKPRRIMLSGADSLTPSERRVAEMAACGMTSRTIAEQLFVTQKTVETHLGHIYRKLDIPGRRHIAAVLTADATS